MKKNKTNLDNGDVLLLSENSSFIMKEDYKTLRTNISFSFSDTDPKVIAVTSALRAEGKSTNSINLAISYAQIGAKTLLIDSDMRLPTISAKLGITSKKGLSDVLVGESDIDNAIVRNTKHGIDILTAGMLPPDPTKLLNSDNVKLMIQHLKDEYDIIIVDCPPVNLVVDAVLWSAVADGFVLVVRDNITRHKDIVEMLVQLEKGNANILGIVYVNTSSVGGKKNYGYGKYNKKYYYYSYK